MKKKNNFNNNNNNRFAYIFGIFIFLVIMGSLIWVNSQYTMPTQVTYSDILNLFKTKQVKKIDIDSANSTSYVVLSNDEKLFAKTPKDSQFLNQAYESGARVSIFYSESWGFYFFLFLILALIAMALYFVFSFFKGIGGSDCGPGGKLFNLGKSKAKFHPADSIKVKFSDVAGLVEIKDELKDVVDFLKNPEKFKKIGAKIPKGVLLSGEPGNGKTLLAKAVAGEAGRPFLSISGSDFVEVFVGVGASRVRDIFFQAQRNAPAIIFIDELDTIGRARGSGIGGGNDEREQTLNQLLSEMDGFTSESGQVIVIGATNRVDVLDKALLRPGRFDRIVKVPDPDLSTRKEILKIHSRGVRVAQEVDLDKIARGTTGCSGADLANLVNEAALFAVKSGRKDVLIEDFEHARDKLFLGPENKSIIRSSQELEQTAYHEAGHALVNILLKDADPFHKVTIVARGHALGVSMSLPEKDTYTRSFNWMMARVKIALGGYIVEKEILRDQTSGVSSDLEAATRIVRQMVCRFGMSKLGPISLGIELDRTGKIEYSQAMADKIDSEVKALINLAEDETTHLIKDNLDKLEILVKNLLEYETLSASQAYQLLGLKPKETHSFRPSSEAQVEPEHEKKD